MGRFWLWDWRQKTACGYVGVLNWLYENSIRLAGEFAFRFKQMRLKFGHPLR
jgi:hypothetical protein